jgi:hypothetical protein
VLAGIHVEVKSGVELLRKKVIVIEVMVDDDEPVPDISMVTEI